jgi:hypothetical protein
MTKTYPPCYRCNDQTPLTDARHGLCRKCELEVRAAAEAEPLIASCSKCAWWFTSDWERIQHEVNQRHNYRAWSSEDKRREGERMVQSRRPAA